MCLFLGGKTSCGNGVRKGRRARSSPERQAAGREPVWGTGTSREGDWAKAGINSLPSMSLDRRGAGCSRLAPPLPSSSPVPDAALGKPKGIPEHAI